MTREEEILQVANENYSGYSERRLGFIAGANWVDKTMLDRACSVFSDILIEIRPELLGHDIKALKNEFRKRLKGGTE